MSPFAGNPDTRSVLEAVSRGDMTVEEALLAIRMAPYEDLGYAKVDLQRAVRQGTPEVIYGEGKTPEQIRGIAGTMLKNGQNRILMTRLSPEKAASLRVLLRNDDADGMFSYAETARIGRIGNPAEPDGLGRIVVATGGTSDLPVAEEAAITAAWYGNDVKRIYDVGVAGMHRLLAHAEDLMEARVVIAVAGMEGALASVIGGLVSCPVIAVPTSIGYGASFGGLSALLSMLNSCAAGISVVNIDNGFGAGFLASRINHMQ